METIDRPRGDLRALARDATASASAHGPAAQSAVPRPKFPWKTRVLVPGGVILILLLLLGYTAKDALFPARAVRVVPVVLRAGGEVSSGGGVTSSAMTVQAPGWVEADPYPIAVTALAGGVVKEMLALEGQTIKAGEVVARLVDDDAKLALAKAEAELAEKQAMLNAAQREWVNPIERTRAVDSGEAMVAETRAEIEKHHADLAVEAAKLAGAKEEFERIQQSFEQKASSEIEVIRAKQQFVAQQATHKAVAAHGEILQAQLKQRQAELTAAKANLRLRIEEAKMLAAAKAAVDLATAAREEAALRLERMDVKSPADGVVMQRLAEPGAKLLLEMDDPRSAQAARLYDPKRLQVRVDVPLADAAKVGVGMEAKIVVGVLPDRTFNGKVTRIVNEADIQKNTLQVKVAITDPSPELKPEMLARVRFVGNGGASAMAGATAMPSMAGAGGSMSIFAPQELVHRHAGGGGEASVWVVDPRRSVAVHRSVVVGNTEHEGWVSIASGLAAGDQLIVDYEGLSDGQRIRVAGEADPSTLKAEAKHGTH